MADQLQLRGGTTNEHSTFTGALREVTVDTDKDTLIVHDAATAGGHPLLREDGSNSALSLGTAGTPALKFTGDANTGIYSPGADQVAISTGGSGRLFVAASGNVGVGTTSPSRNLTVSNGTNAIIAVQNSGQSTEGVFNAPSGGTVNLGTIGSTDLTLSTNNTERARIDSSGRLLVGTSTARTNFFNSAVAPKLQIEGTSTSNDGPYAVVVDNANTANGPRWIFGKSRSTGNTIVQSGDRLGGLEYQGNDGSQFVGAANIECYVDGTPGANDMPGRLVFSTTADGAASPTERMRIDSSGNVGIGSAPVSAKTLAVNGNVQFGDGGGFDMNANGTRWQFSLAGTERMRLDSSGRLGLGTSSPSTNLEISSSNCKVRITDNDSASAGNCSLEWAFSGGRNGYIGYGGSNDLYVWQELNNKIRFGTNSTDALTIDSSQRVGIGTTSPGADLDIGGQLRFSNYSATDNIIFTDSDSSRIRLFGGSTASVSNGAAISLQGASHPSGNYLDLASAVGGHVQFRTGTTERLRIDSSGRLLIGTTTGGGVNYGGSTGGFHLVQGNADAHLMIRRAGSNGSLTLIRSNGTVAAPTAVANNDVIGQIRFVPYDGTDYTHQCARISAEIDGIPGSNDLPGRLVFSTTADGGSSPTERIRIDSSGRVGIGTTSPNKRLTVAGDTATGIRVSGSTQGGAIEFDNNGSLTAAVGNIGNILSNSDNGLMLYASSTNTIRFAQGANERVRIDSSGRLLVGTSTNSENVIAAFQGFQGSSTGQGIIAIKRGSTPSSGNTVAQIRFNGPGTDEECAFITAVADGAWGSGDYPGRLVFSTTADGASSPTERMRISSNGRVFIATTAQQFGPANLTVLSGGVSGIVSRNNAAGGWNLICGSSSNSGTYYFAAFQRHDTSALIGQITSTNGTSTTYGTTSDYRLKENVQPLTDAINRVKQLQPKRFNFIANTEETLDGFLAHEVDEVTPQAVVGAKDAVEDDGQIKPQCIDHSMLVPLLTAALQEALQKIETLEQRLSDAGIA
jgi:hypothetical protein